VRFFADVPAAEERAGQNAHWRNLVVRAIGEARGIRDREPGPIHLNVAFREPLVPELSPQWPEVLTGRPRGAPWTRLERLSTERFVWLPAGPRTVVVAGDGADPRARWLAETAGWPLLAEPSSGARSGPNALGPYRLLLGVDDHPLLEAVERVVVYGRPTLSRPVTRLLARSDIEVVVVARSGEWADPSLRAARVGPAVAVEGTEEGAGRAEPDAWLRAWLEADQRASRCVVEVLRAEPALTGLHVARTVAAAVPAGGLLHAASSNPIRDLDVAADPWDNPLVDDRGRLSYRVHRRVLANRGLAGIDGTVSTAIGAALAHRHGPAYALVGDLAFLHDANCLLRGPQEPAPDLTVTVVNDDGGGIFTTLEQGAPEFADRFERLFGTPHGADLGALAAATGTPHVLARTPAELRAALGEPDGLRLVEVRVDRTRIRGLHTRLRDRVRTALQDLPFTGR